MTKRQFHVLYRGFLLQIVDLELLPSDGDPSRLLLQIAAMLGALSFILGVLIIPKYGSVTAAQIAAGSWGDQEFLISTSMAVVGLFTVLAWDSIFPDRRDSLVLGALPLRSRTIFFAKVASITTGLGVSLLAVNFFTGLGYPFALGSVRTFFAYWLTIVAAGLSMFCTLLAAQGLAALLLRYRLFLKVSNALQVVAFFSILSVYFLTPGPSDIDLPRDGTIPELLWRLPSFWFVGLFQLLNGSPQPRFVPLAPRAIWWLAGSVSLAILAYAFSYYRNMRRIVEEPDIAPAERGRSSSAWVSWLAAQRMKTPLERAVLLFLARTLARSRQHRNLLAAFGGLALAISLVFAKSLVYGNSQMYAMARRWGFQPPRWYQMNSPMMAAGFVLLIVAIMGTRAAFSLPAALKANWLFRTAAVHSPRAYFDAIRKSVLTFAVVVWAVVALFYLSAWDGWERVGHAGVLLAICILTVYYAFTGFEKMPFACAYTPGESNMRVVLPMYGALFLFGVTVVTEIERSAFETAGRTVVLGVVLLALILHARRRWRAFADDPFEQLRFEGGSAFDFTRLNLTSDNSDRRFYGYLDVIQAPPERELKERALAFARKIAIVTASVCAVGFVYEQVCRLLYPLPARVGQSVDIGGRSLNYSCAGEGSPTVIFESGAGGPGMIWTSAQKEVSRYTRACWYDRAGYGWSDAAPFPHPASAIADDLHRLLEKAGVPGPYVLVGASFGGICVRVFADKYRAEVAGLVLEDSTHIDERTPITPPGGGYLPYNPLYFSMFVQALRPVGILRMFLPKRDWGPFEPRTFAESFKELGAYESLLEERAINDLGDIPMIVLTAGRHRINPPDNPIDARKQRAWEANFVQAQQQMTHLSTRAEQRIFPDASHNMMLGHSADVLKAIHDMVLQARDNGKSRI